MEFPKLNESDREKLRVWVGELCRRAQGQLDWATEQDDKTNAQYYLGRVHAYNDVIWELDKQPMGTKR